MKTVLVLLAAASLSSIAAAGRPGITVADPWIALPPMGAPTAAGYGAIRNTGGAPDVLLSASTPMAAAAQMHAMSMMGGIMRMRPVSGGMAIAPGGSLQMGPGGYHLMLVRPQHPLKLGERVPVILTFAKSGRIRTLFVVKPAVGGMVMP